MTDETTITVTTALDTKIKLIESLTPYDIDRVVDWKGEAAKLYDFLESWSTTNFFNALKKCFEAKQKNEGE